MASANNNVIERLLVEVEVVGMAQIPGQPPQTEAYFHVRRRQDGGAEGVLGLPFYKGDKGDRGPALQIFVVSSAANIPQPGTLTSADYGKGWRVEGENSVKFWTSQGFQTHWNWLGTEGPQGGPGPANKLAPGTIEMLPEGHAPTIDITGTAPNQTLSIGIPSVPGEQGETGPAAAITASTDYTDGGTPATAGQVLAMGADGKWRPVKPISVLEEYVVPPASFPNATKQSSEQRHQLVSVPIPAKPYPYRFNFSGGVDVQNKVGHQVDVEIRLDNPTSGQLVGLGKGQDGEGWREVMFRAHSDTAYQPGSTVGVIPAGTAVTLHCVAVLRSGFLLGWAVRRDLAQLRIQLVSAA